MNHNDNLRKRLSELKIPAGLPYAELVEIFRPYKKILPSMYRQVLKNAYAIENPNEIALEDWINEDQEFDDYPVNKSVKL